MKLLTCRTRSNCVLPQMGWWYLIVHEDFIGMYPMKGTGADQIVFLIKDILFRMNLRLQDARGQCCDGAAAMAGAKTGVATQIKAINGKCLYTHCDGHALNLAVGDSVKSVACLKSLKSCTRFVSSLRNLRNEIRSLMKWENNQTMIL